MAEIAIQTSDKHPNRILEILKKRFPEKLMIQRFSPSNDLLYYLGMTSHHFMKIVRCEKPVTVEQAQRIAQWLECEPQDVFPSLNLNGHGKEKSATTD